MLTAYVDTGIHQMVFDACSQSGGMSMELWVYFESASGQVPDLGRWVSEWRWPPCHCIRRVSFMDKGPKNHATWLIQTATRGFINFTSIIWPMVWIYFFALIDVLFCEDRRFISEAESTPLHHQTIEELSTPLSWVARKGLQCILQDWYMQVLVVCFFFTLVVGTPTHLTTLHFPSGTFSQDLHELRGEGGGGMAIGPTGVPVEGWSWGWVSGIDDNSHAS